MTAVEKQQEQSFAHLKTIPGVPEGQDARILASRARALMPEGRVLIHVARDDARLAEIRDLLSFFAPDVRIVTFPAWDCLPYDRVSPHGDLVAQRVAALSALLEWRDEAQRYPRLLLTTVNALGQRVMPCDALMKAVFTVERGKSLNPESLRTFLHDNGYVRTDTVREPGEYAFRGGIIDLFPPGREEPVRLDLFGDEVESIRAFDPVSQRTDKKLSGFSLRPATEFFLNDESIARFRSGYRERFGAVRADDPLYEAVSAGRRYSGMEHWQPLFFESMDLLTDYVPGAILTFDYQAAQAAAERHAQIADFYQARQALAAGLKTGSGFYNPLPPEVLYLGEAQWDEWTAQGEHLSPFAGADDQTARRGRDFGDIRALPDGDLFGVVAAYVEEQRRSAVRKIVIASYSPGSRERLRSMMMAAGMANIKDVNSEDDLRKLEVFETGLSVLPLAQGFSSADLTVITEQDILGDRLARRSGRRRKADNFLREVSALAPGDLVVHIDHGIGRFESLETIHAAGRAHDCLKITYAGDDRLYVPVENIEVLSRFGSDEGIVTLDRLGGVGWQARKAKVKKDLMRMADGLLKIAAARQLQKAEALPVDIASYQDFAARFPWQETEDQQRSIDDVLGDLAAPRPMDRLVCGDVGFGKTEVALRAAYVAAMNGTQVAVVVPTTLLARQHYRNFSERFAGTGLRVAQLSRLVGAAEAPKVRDGLADGAVNIVIGTHALFASTVKFNHLGLLIVDEEQRFGVKQKEKLKELKANIHVLTLTATPIPRTLQMSLTGVRDLSLITTPPVDRLAVRTFVMPFDPVIIRDALLREHYRGGQSFYVCPRIADMAELEEMLKTLVPEVKIIAAHGQMSAADLEDRMNAFYDGQYDVLLATNIIESGLDIPRANTMVVHRADLFGLAQMYQIRGRIGRSKVRGYAYLTFEPGRALTAQAQKRLEVIETLDTLGAGFQLASHDMDIRGAGNLLGEEQSGHVREVGIELYQQMLEEAVAAAREGLDFTKGAELPDHWSPTINLGTSVLIPEHYVEDLGVRMSLYRRLTDLIDKNDIETFRIELIDRFGPLPDEVDNLLQVIEIKQLCKGAGVDRVDAGPKGAVIGFYKDTHPNPAAIMKWVQVQGAGVKIRPDQKIAFQRSWDKPAHRVAGVRSLISSLPPVQE